jgi:hypothetical protein
VQAINYFVANNYIKALESLAKSPNQKVLMMPVEASSVIGIDRRHRRNRQGGVRLAAGVRTAAPPAHNAVTKCHERA